MSSALNSLLLRIVSDPNYQTKGSTLTWEELDNNFKLIADVIRELNSLDPGGIEAYNPEKEYSIGDYVSYQNNLWEYIYPTPSTGNAPGLTSDYWAIRSSGALSHAQNTDTHTTSKEFGIGDGTDATMSIYARNADTNKPRIRYNHTTNKWQFSNDGETYKDLGSGGSWSELEGDPSDNESFVEYVDEVIADLEDTGNKGQPDGYAGLDGDGKVPAGQLPSASDSVPGISKLYDQTGANDDGTITQKAVTSALDSLRSKIYVGSYGSF